MYNKRTWLNKPHIASTSNVVAFEGNISYKGKQINNVFLSISDCYNSIKIHQSDDESLDDFIDKMALLRDEIDAFIAHLLEKED